MSELKDVTESNKINENQNHDLAIANVGSMSQINIFDNRQLAAAELFLNKIIRSERSGIKSVNDGLAIMMRAQDLGLPFSTCIEHIHVINGKTGIDIHIAKALLSRAGCTWECTKDYQPLYEYTDGINVYTDNSFPDYLVRCKSQTEAESKAKADMEKEINDNVYVYPVKWYKDVNGNMYKDYQLNAKQFGIAINKQQVVEITKQNKIAVYRVANNPIDYVTEYKFSRNVNGKEINAVSSFTYSEAVKAGFFDKPTYQQYPKVMISHRAWMYGARDIASDILFGVMETKELKIVTDTNLNAEDFIEVEEVN